MFGRNLTLFEVFGFRIQVNITWVFLALFIALSLALGTFPELYAGLPATAYWWMAIIAVIGLFSSIVVHELAHSLVARRFGMQMRGITLFLLGGAAEMEEEPPTPKAEFWMAIAGPLTSVAVAAAFYALAAIVGALGGAPAMVAVFEYLALLNIVLAVFNLIPAFPLDGGRALRAALWHWTGSLRRATRTASRIGSLFAFVLVAGGIVNALSGNVIGGIWWFMIGMFVHSAATGSFFQLEARRILEGERVSRFMVRDPVTVPPGITVSRLVEDYIYRHFHDVFPVVDGDRLLGCVGVREIKAVPRERWGDATTDQVMTPATADNTIDANADAVEALSRMQRTGNSRLLVTEGGRLAGVVALKDMMRLLSLRIDLEGDGVADQASPPPAPRPAQ